MWFKNLFIYRLNNWTNTPEQLEHNLGKHALVACAGNEVLTRGWIAPKTENAPLVHTMGAHLLIALGTEKKLLPVSVVNQFAKIRVTEIEERDGYKPSRKHMKEIKETVRNELLPRAFVIRSKTCAWIDPVNHWLIVDAANASKAEDLMGLLLKSVDGPTVLPLKTQSAPSTTMTNWLIDNDSPYQFTIDQDCELRSKGEQKATVRYAKHTPDPEELHKQIKSGKAATRLAMTWSDRVAFVLHDNLQLKRISPLNVLKEKHALNSDDDAFDTDFALMAGELSKLLPALIDTLGGEFTPNKISPLTQISTTV